MTTRRSLRHTPRLSLLAAALLPVFATAHAAEVSPEVARLVEPTSTVTAGVGYLADDNQRYGMYTGLLDTGYYALVDLDLIRRYDDTGTWFVLTGRNVGLDNRRARVEHERQGNWGYFLDYSLTPRHNPLIVNTAASGLGSDHVTLPAAATAGPAVGLKTERETYKFGLSKALGAGLDFNLRVRSENKDGERMWGRRSQGSPGTPGFGQFLAEPIDSTINIVEATLAYTAGPLQLNGGYYGTSYNNQVKSLVVNGFTDTNANVISPIGLPPDNQSHQFFVNGGYNLGRTTRASFKLAYTRATQDDRFIPVATAAGVGNGLDGQIDTTLVYASLSSRPLPKLSVAANVRYEDRDDKTPIRQYFDGVLGANSTWDGRNEPRSLRSTSGKVEASYHLDGGYRLTAGVEYDEKQRNTSPVRAVSYRKRTDESAYRLELRRSMSESVNGAIAYIHSERNGSDFVTTTLKGGTEGSNLIAPLHLADRQRDRLRATIEWAPLSALSLQLMYEQSQDDYGMRVWGIDRGSSRFYSLDASYAISDAWRATAWLSRQHNEARQTSISGTTAWAAQLRDNDNSAGFGVEGAVTSKLMVGLDVQHSLFRNEYNLERLSGASAVNSLPETFYRLITAQLTGKYAVRRDLSFRLDYRYDRYVTDDWTWTNWTYVDGTTVTEAPSQTVHFIGVSASYRFQ